MKSALPEDLEVSRGTDKERLFTKSDFGTNQASDLDCKKVVDSLGKSGSVYTYDRNLVSNRPPRIDGALSKVVPTSLPGLILYLAYCQVDGGTRP